MMLPMLELRAGTRASQDSQYGGRRFLPGFAVLLHGREIAFVEESHRLLPALEAAIAELDTLHRRLAELEQRFPIPNP